MSNSTKAFIISLVIHLSLFSIFIDFEQKKTEKKEVIVLNMNMIQNISQKELIQEPQVEKKTEEKIEEKAELEKKIKK